MTKKTVGLSDTFKGQTSPKNFTKPPKGNTAICHLVPFLSKPDINVPIKVTERTPIIIPNAVKRDLVLLSNTADNEILKFSIKRRIISLLFFDLL